MTVWQNPLVGEKPDLPEYYRGNPLVPTHWHGMKPIMLKYHEHDNGDVSVSAIYSTGPVYRPARKIVRKKRYREH